MGPLRGIARGAALAALGGLLLLASLFLDWYQPGFSAWTVFEFVDLVLAAIAVGAVLGAAGLLGAGRQSPAALPAVAGLAVLLVAAQILNHPPAAVGRDPKAGLWVALGASLLLLIGASLDMSRRPAAERAAPDWQRPG